MKEKVTGKLIEIGADFVVIENEGSLPTESIEYLVEVGDEVDAFLNEKYIIVPAFYKARKFICLHCNTLQLRYWPHPTGNACNQCREYMDGEPT